MALSQIELVLFVSFLSNLQLCVPSMGSLVSAFELGGLDIPAQADPSLFALTIQTCCMHRPIPYPI